MKKVSSFLLAALAGLWLVACDQNSKSTDNQKSAVENPPVLQQELMVVTPWEITSEDPSKSGYIFQRLQLAETLVDADENGI